MIYCLEDSYIDLDKLERISHIKSTRHGGLPVYFFRYSVNTFTWDTRYDLNRDNVKNMRNHLIDTWKAWKKGETV